MSMHTPTLNSFRLFASCVFLVAPIHLAVVIEFQTVWTVSMCYISIIQISRVSIDFTSHFIVLSSHFDGGSFST